MSSLARVTLSGATVSSGVVLSTGTPSTTANVLYNVDGTLMFNGASVAGAGSGSTFTSLQVNGGSTLAGALQSSATTLASLSVVGGSTLGTVQAGNSTVGTLTAGASSVASLHVTGASTLGTLQSGASTFATLSGGNSTLAKVRISTGGVALADAVPAATTGTLYRSGEALMWNSSAVGGGESASTNLATVSLSTIVTVASTANWTNLVSFPLAAGSLYEFDFMLYYRVKTSTDGLKAGVQGPTASTQVAVHVFLSTGVGTPVGGSFTAFSTGPVSRAIGSTAVISLGNVYGVTRTSNSTETLNLCVKATTPNNLLLYPPTGGVLYSLGTA